jgi:DNA-binding MarR family transcriptional regulator
MPADGPTLTIARLGRLLEAHAAASLSLPQYRVLGVLASGEERATQLAARIAVAKPTLTALVDSLVDRGYVARESLDGDRRAVTLSITPAGRVALDATAALLRTALDDVVSRCAHPEEVLAALDEMADALDARWTESAAR